MTHKFLESVDKITIGSFLAVFSLLIVAYLASLVFFPRANKVDRATFIWYAFDALTHFILEGSFIWLSTFGRTVLQSEGPFAELWKEYAKADLRWGMADITVITLEIFTVLFCGPLCVYLLYAIVVDAPGRHYWQVVLCTCEIYGGWMTFGPEWLTGSRYLNTSNALYTWVYLAFFNGIWVIIPLALMIQSFSEINRGIRLLQSQRIIKKSS